MNKCYEMASMAVRSSSNSPCWATAMYGHHHIRSNFSQKNMIRRSGFGVVYKGGLCADRSAIVVKRITESEFQGDDSFRNEVKILSNLQHRNLSPLWGYCITDDSDDEEGGGGGWSGQYGFFIVVRVRESSQG
ncbi:hypothetical protein Taro_039380 [Colocasia esculenta]|uniref:Protein kinase domain-containing protein n=1 Tax=Colocasia esculenta TaxID=4460 RepID=A0A843WGI8_COLES|nr:hypothetical protein [Colocasia esculenta]